MLRSGSTVLKRVVVNLNKSKGCRLVDNKGKEYLDLHSNIASLPLGFNHPSLTQLIQDPNIGRLAIHRQATNLYPPTEHIQQLENCYSRISPFQNPFLHLTSSGSEAIESIIKYCTRRPDGNGMPLAFGGGFHGRTLGALSITRTNPEHTYGFPSIASKIVSFPDSEQDEEQSLHEIEEAFGKHTEITCAIVEPIQSEGGDRFASSKYFNEVRDLCTKYSKLFIVDEVQTAMGTGGIWAHEPWPLKTPPDAVVFSKKLQASGVFLRSSLVNDSDLYAFNSTWAGDALRGAMLSVILDVVEKEDLLSLSEKNGNKLFDELRTISSIKNVRNLGSFGAFDVDYPDFYVKKLQDNGLLVSKCGHSSIRIRPALVLSQEEVNEAISIFKSVL